MVKWGRLSIAVLYWTVFHTIQGTANEGRPIQSTSDKGRAIQGTADEVSASGEWAAWTPWSSCPLTCGAGGEAVRTRQCTARPCEGSGKETRHCNGTVEGTWGQWSSWSACSATCGRGTRTIRRQCYFPVNDSTLQDTCAKSCIGPDVKRKRCWSKVDGTWGQWSSWSACSVTCGRGTQTIRRHCYFLVTNNMCTKRCRGKDEKIKRCWSNVEGTWGQWSSWSACSVTCGRGTRTIRRQCYFPVNDSTLQDTCAKSCIGPDVKTEGCWSNVTSRDFTLTPGGANGQMKEGGDLVLTCAGTVAEGANRSAVDIVWEYRSLGETAWRQLEGDDMRVAQPAPPTGCQLVVHRLTAQSRDPGDAGWTYRCYPLVDGQSLRDRAGTYTPDSPDTPDASDSPDVPDTPDAPHSPDVLDTPDSPDSPDTPDAAHSPDTPDSPDVPDTPDTPDAPHSPDVLDTPDSPDSPDTPDAPHSPDTPDSPDAPDIPDAEDSPDSPDAPDAPDSPDNPDAPDTPNTLDTPDAPDTPDNPDAPDTPNTPDAPDTPDADVSPAHPVLTIRPSTVVITGVDEHHVVTALCRIRPAVGHLVSLQLTRWSSVSDATVTLVQATADSELYTVNLPAAVARGGFSQRFINYTFLQVNCNDDGRYECHATYQLVTGDKTLQDSVYLQVREKYFYSRPQTALATNISAGKIFKCSTLVPKYFSLGDIKWRWRWQWVPTNDEVEDARPTWTDVDPRSVRSLPLTITMQNCSQVSTTVLTVLVDNLDHSHRRFCCTVSANERSYIIGTTKLNVGHDKPSAQSSREATAFNIPTLVLVSLLPAILLLPGLACILAAVIKYKNMKEARPQEANVPDPPELPDPTSPPSDISEELNDRDSAESNV